MKRFQVLGVALVLLTAGCGALATSALNGVVSNPVAPIAQASTYDEKGLYVAEAAYNGLGNAIKAGLRAGLIKGATARLIATYEAEAYKNLKRLRAAHASANAPAFNFHKDQVDSAIAEAWKLINGSK